jgi:hypothetical protein
MIPITLSLQSFSAIIAKLYFQILQFYEILFWSHVGLNIKSLGFMKFYFLWFFTTSWNLKILCWSYCFLFLCGSFQHWMKLLSYFSSCHKNHLYYAVCTECCAAAELLQHRCRIIVASIHGTHTGSRKAP